MERASQQDAGRGQGSIEGNGRIRGRRAVGGPVARFSVQQSQTLTSWNKPKGRVGRKPAETYMGRPVIGRLSDKGRMHAQAHSISQAANNKKDIAQAQSLWVHNQMAAEFGAQADANPGDGRDEVQVGSRNARIRRVPGPGGQSPPSTNQIIHSSRPLVPRRLKDGTAAQERLKGDFEQCSGHTAVSVHVDQAKSGALFNQQASLGQTQLLSGSVNHEQEQLPPGSTDMDSSMAATVIAGAANEGQLPHQEHAQDDSTRIGRPSLTLDAPLKEQEVAIDGKVRMTAGAGEASHLVAVDSMMGQGDGPQLPDGNQSRGFRLSSDLGQDGNRDHDQEDLNIMVDSEGHGAQGALQTPPDIHQQRHKTSKKSSQDGLIDHRALPRDQSPAAGDYPLGYLPSSPDEADQEEQQMMRWSQNLEFQKQVGGLVGKSRNEDRYPGTNGELRNPQGSDHGKQEQKDRDKASKTVHQGGSSNEVQVRMDKVSRLFHNNHEMSLSVRDDYAQLMLSSRFEPQFRFSEIFNQYNAHHSMNNKKLNFNPFIKDKLVKHCMKPEVTNQQKRLDGEPIGSPRKSTVSLADCFTTQKEYLQYIHSYTDPPVKSTNASLSPQIYQICMAKKYKQELLKTHGRSSFHGGAKASSCFMAETFDLQRLNTHKNLSGTHKNSGELKEISLLKNISQSLESLINLKGRGDSVQRLDGEDQPLREERYDDHGQGAMTEMRQSEHKSNGSHRKEQMKIKGRSGRVYYSSMYRNEPLPQLGIGDINRDEQAPQRPPEAWCSHQKRMFKDKSVAQITGLSTTGLLDLGVNQSKKDLEERHPLVGIGSGPEPESPLAEHLRGEAGSSTGAKRAGGAIQNPGRAIPPKRWRPQMHRGAQSFQEAYKIKTPSAKIAVAHNQRHLASESHSPFSQSPHSSTKQPEKKQEKDDQNSDRVLMDDLVEEEENSVEMDSPVAENGPRLTQEGFYKPFPSNYTKKQRKFYDSAKSQLDERQHLHVSKPCDQRPVGKGQPASQFTTGYSFCKQTIKSPSSFADPSSGPMSRARASEMRNQSQGPYLRIAKASSNNGHKDSNLRAQKGGSSGLRDEPDVEGMPNSRDRPSVQVRSLKESQDALCAQGHALSQTQPPNKRKQRAVQMQLLQSSLIVPSPIQQSSGQSQDLSTEAMNKETSPQHTREQRSRVELPNIHHPKSLRSSFAQHSVADQESGNQKQDQGVQTATNFKKKARSRPPTLKNTLTIAPCRKEQDGSLSPLKSLTSHEKLDLISQELLNQMTLPQSRSPALMDSGQSSRIYSKNKWKEQLQHHWSISRQNQQFLTIQKWRLRPFQKQKGGKRGTRYSPDVKMMQTGQATRQDDPFQALLLQGSNRFKEGGPRHPGPQRPPSDLSHLSPITGSIFVKDGHHQGAPNHDLMEESRALREQERGFNGRQRMSTDLHAVREPARINEAMLLGVQHRGHDASGERQEPSKTSQMRATQ